MTFYELNSVRLRVNWYVDKDIGPLTVAQYVSVHLKH